jgi:transcription termination factor NusG
MLSDMSELERLVLGLDLTIPNLGERADLNSAIANTRDKRLWFTVYTLPQNEKSVLRHLDLKGIESSFPTYEALRLWKNLQGVLIELPLFPSYLLARVNRFERAKVQGSLEVLCIVRYGSEPVRDIGRRSRVFTFRIVRNETRAKSGSYCGRKGISHRAMQGVQGDLG